MGCLLNEKCVVKNIEYYVVINGIDMKMDNCFTNFFGYSRCTLNDTTYKNISYTEKVVGTKEIDGYNLFPVIILCFCFMSFFPFLSIIRRIIKG